MIPKPFLIYLDASRIYKARTDSNNSEQWNYQKKLKHDPFHLEFTKYMLKQKRIVVYSGANISSAEGQITKKFRAYGTKYFYKWVTYFNNLSYIAIAKPIGSLKNGSRFKYFSKPPRISGSTSGPSVNDVYIYKNHLFYTPGKFYELIKSLDKQKTKRVTRDKTRKS